MGNPLQSLSPVDTSGLFEPLHHELLVLLSELSGTDWTLPTVAGAWEVRDIVAHLIDGQMRRLSFQRDGIPMPSPQAPMEGYESLVAFLNELNAEWVQAMRRVSPAQLLALLDHTGREYAEFVAGLDPEGEAFFPVAWAGESASKNWMDMGRDYTELWHHQAQIREAVGAVPLISWDWLFPVLDLGIRGVYRSWAGFEGDPADVVLFSVGEEPEGQWSIVWEEQAWVVYRGAHPHPTAQASMSPETAWKLLFNALQPGEAGSAIASSGNQDLITRMLDVRGVMV